MRGGATVGMGGVAPYGSQWTGGCYKPMTEASKPVLAPRQPGRLISLGTGFRGPRSLKTHVRMYVASLH